MACQETLNNLHTYFNITLKDVWEFLIFVFPPISDIFIVPCVVDTLWFICQRHSINFTTCFWTRNEIRCHGKGVLLNLELAWAERSSTGGIGRKGGRNWDGTLEMAFVCRAQWLKNWAKLKRCHMQRKWLRLPHIHALTQTQMDRHTYRYKQNLLRISPACRGHQIASHLWCNKRQHNLQRHQAIQSSDAPSLSFPLSAYPLCLSLFALLSQLAGIVNGICWPHSAHTHTNLERILSRKMVCPYPRALRVQISCLLLNLAKISNQMLATNSPDRIFPTKLNSFTTFSDSEPELYVWKMRSGWMWGKIKHNPDILDKADIIKDFSRSKSMFKVWSALKNCGICLTNPTTSPYGGV